MGGWAASPLPPSPGPWGAKHVLMWGHSSRVTAWPTSLLLHPGYGPARSQGRLPVGSRTGWSEAHRVRREVTQAVGPRSLSSDPRPASRATSRLPGCPQCSLGTCPSRRKAHAPPWSPAPVAAPGNRSEPGQHVTPFTLRARWHLWARVQATSAATWLSSGSGPSERSSSGRKQVPSFPQSWP